MLRDALEQQIQSLKNQNDKMATDLEMMASEVQRIKESRENERVLLDSREVEMGKKTQALASKMGGLQREYQKIKSQNRALKDTVVRYQKELKEARKDKAMKSAPPSSSEMAKSSPSVKSVRKETVAPVAASLKGSLAPVNINSASANDLVLFLGLTKEMAEKVVANRPYRLRGELVAKNVIPKATFDVIKDRISASQ
jgi:DNA uptake protein ComE-like DNA-binding protein